MKILRAVLIGSFIWGMTNLATAQPDSHTGHNGDQHPVVEIPLHNAAPRIELDISRDKMSGYNLHIDYDRFELESPRHANDASKQYLEGHAHLYINGKKIQRIYGPDLHLPDKLFKSGFNQITVTLNAHDHSTWSRGGKRILATLFIRLDKPDLILHRFSTSPIKPGVSTGKSG
ncbi:hypothetical protein ACJJIQ_23690 [Microbulbifer sp. ANSA003]|uniref:hypothetical protein n=1 Tax=unclassified Microbulbifer TaxID=2619833 RepID=UPI00403A3A56